MRNADFDQFDFKAPWMPQELYDIVLKFRGGMPSRQPPHPAMNCGAAPLLLSFFLYTHLDAVRTSTAMTIVMLDLDVIRSRREVSDDLRVQTATAVIILVN